MELLNYLDPQERLDRNVRKALVEADRSMWAGDYAGAAQSIKKVARRGNDRDKAFVALFRGEIDHFEWRQGGAKRYYERAIRGFDAVRERPPAIFATYRLVDTEVDRNPSQGASTADRTRFDEAFAEAQRLKDDFLVAFGHHYRGLFALAVEDAETARGELEKAIAIRERIGDTIYIHSSRTLLAQAMARLGSEEEGLALAERTYRDQIERGLRSAAFRTLLNIRSIQERRAIDQGAKMVETFAPSGPGGTSPFTRQVNVLEARFRPAVERLSIGLALHS